MDTAQEALPDDEDDLNLVKMKLKLLKHEYKECLQELILLKEDNKSLLNENSDLRAFKAGVMVAKGYDAKNIHW